MDIKKCLKLISDKAIDPEVERVFRKTCLLYESECSASNKPLSQDYQELLNLYHYKTSLYCSEMDNNRAQLIIYDTESEIEREELILNAPEWLETYGFIVHLPYGQLFWHGRKLFDEITLTIDRKYRFRTLPSDGITYNLSAGIYFNHHVYCFGGYNSNSNLSCKFDLNKNKWIYLTPMPIPTYCCYLLVFNRNILISGYYNVNLLLYSIDINSFSTIPYSFANAKRKVLINAERLYLFEYKEGLVYESEDEYNWKIISKSITGEADGIFHIYCLYNKGGIYIGTNGTHWRAYYKFDLNEKVIVKL